MKKKLLAEIDTYMREAAIGPHRFGILSVNNGRLVERLRNGGRIWPETEAKVRAYIKSHPVQTSSKITEAA